MTISPPIPVILRDCFCCLGLGLLLALTLDALTLLFPGKVGRFLLDVLGFSLAAVMLYSFGAGRSGTGVPRWFHAAGLLMGVLGYACTLAPVTGTLRNRLRSLIGRGMPPKKGQKQRTSSKKVSPEPEKQLPKKGKMLYNS